MCLCQTAHPHGIDTCQQKSIAGRWVVAITGRQPNRPSLHRRRPTMQVAIPCRSFFTIIPNSGYQDRLCNSRRCGLETARSCLRNKYRQMKAAPSMLGHQERAVWKPHLRLACDARRILCYVGSERDIFLCLGYKLGSQSTKRYTTFKNVRYLQVLLTVSSV